MEINDILNVNKSSNYNKTDYNYSSGKEGKFDRLLQKHLSDDMDTNAEWIYKRNTKPVDKRLMNTCIEMESIFVSKMLKEMRNTIPESKLIDGGYAEKIFEDLLYDEYALNLSKTSNMGIAKMLYDELSRK